MQNFALACEYRPFENWSINILGTILFLGYFMMIVSTQSGDFVNTLLHFLRIMFTPDIVGYYTEEIFCSTVGLTILIYLLMLSDLIFLSAANTACHPQHIKLLDMHV
ncbi:hypothetical protein ACJX0J_024859 [Zea mays]